MDFFTTLSDFHLYFILRNKDEVQAYNDELCKEPDSIKRFVLVNYKHHTCVHPLSEGGLRIFLEWYMKRYNKFPTAYIYNGGEPLIKVTPPGDNCDE